MVGARELSALWLQTDFDQHRSMVTPSCLSLVVNNSNTNKSISPVFGHKAEVDMPRLVGFELVIVRRVRFFPMADAVKSVIRADKP